MLHRDLYFGVRELVTTIFARWGLKHSFVDMRNIEEVRAACRPETRLLWLETPTNPLIEVIDILPVAECARSLQIPLACENTFASPVLQRPFELGADLVICALTKYLSGHCDALGGAVIFRQKSELATRIKDFQRVGGAVLSHSTAALIMRGLQTLVPRMRPALQRMPATWRNTCPPTPPWRWITNTVWRPTPVTRLPPGRCATLAGCSPLKSVGDVRKPSPSPPG